MEADINQLLEVAYEAGEAIMYHFRSIHLHIEQKSDHSPLTIADRESNFILQSALQRISTYPVISEESKQIPYEERCYWQRFWLVDPLDGTKSFIKGEETFTINIALVENNYPTFGLIYAPALQTAYIAHQGKGAFRIKAGQAAEPLLRVELPTYLTALISQSHQGEQDKQLLEGLPIQHYIPLSSALKFGWIAEGKAHIYVRTGPTMEWDTAAGQAIVESLGGVVLSTQQQERLTYNKVNLQNDGFICKLFPEIKPLLPPC